MNEVAAGLGPTLDRATAEVRNLTDVSRALLEAATERRRRADPGAAPISRRRPRHFFAGFLTGPATVRSPETWLAISQACRANDDVGAGVPRRRAPTGGGGPRGRDGGTRRGSPPARRPVRGAPARTVPRTGCFRCPRCGVVAGTRCVEVTCSQVDPGLEVTWLVSEGAETAPGDVIGRVEGRLRSLLTAERTALNFLCHLSGVATSTRRYVEAARRPTRPRGSGTPARPRPGCGPSRRPPCGPEVPSTTGATSLRECSSRTTISSASGSATRSAKRSSGGRGVWSRSSASDKRR